MDCRGTLVALHTRIRTNGLSVAMGPKSVLGDRSDNPDRRHRSVNRNKTDPATPGRRRGRGAHFEPLLQHPCGTFAARYRVAGFSASFFGAPLRDNRAMDRHG